MNEQSKKVGSVMVVGGGIAGLSTALHICSEVNPNILIIEIPFSE